VLFDSIRGIRDNSWRPPGQNFLEFTWQRNVVTEDDQMAEESLSFFERMRQGLAFRAQEMRTITPAAEPLPLS
jgi:hypothetical protein